MARYTGRSLPALPARGHEALPQGRALLHRQVRVRAPRVSAGPARPGRRASARTTASSCARSRRSSASTASPSASSAATTTRPSRMKGVTGETCSQLLERRLDNVVYRLGFATRSRRGAPARAPRPLPVNGKKVNIPSYLVRAGDVDRGARGSRRRSRASTRRSPRVDRRGVPQWLELDKENFRGAVDAACRRARTFTLPIREQLIVELYSK